MKSLELDYGQTLFIQQEEKTKEKNAVTEKLQEDQNQEKLKVEVQKAQKEKLENFIKNREEEVLELIPSFIQTNKFLLQQSKIDLEDKEELLKIIK